MEQVNTDIFILYSKEDTEALQRLKTQLSSLERTFPVKIWYDGMVEAGGEWEAEVQAALDKAEIVLILLSADFIASDYCYEYAINRVLSLHQQNKVKAIPILVRACIWKDTPFGGLKMLPQDDIPLMHNSWNTEEEPYVKIADVIRQLVRERMGLPPEKIPEPPLPPSSINLPFNAVPTQPRNSYTYIIIGVMVGLLAIFGIWYATHSKSNAITIDKTPNDTTHPPLDNSPKIDLTTLTQNYQKQIEEADAELWGNPRLDNYVYARYKYQNAISAVRKTKIDTTHAHDGISACNREIRDLGRSKKIDSFYVTTLVSFKALLNKGNDHFLKATSFQLKEVFSMAIQQYRFAKNRYKEAITAAGDSGVEPSIASQGRAKCDEAIWALEALIAAPINDNTTTNSDPKNPPHKTNTVPKNNPRTDPALKFAERVHTDTTAEKAQNDAFLRNLLIYQKQNRNDNPQ